ncbi:MAG: HD domain-containing phosphohydrolase [Tissierellaceae bacterium]|nr:diguanylate cyclase [Tissierellaceae bacterium]
MKTIQERFYLFGTILIIVVALGLLYQYSYLSTIINRDKEFNISTAREHLHHQVDSKMKQNRQCTVAASQVVSIGGHSDEELLTLLRELSQNNQSLKALYFGDVNNKLIISSGWQPPRDYDLRERTWYIEAVKEGGIHVSDVYIDAVDGEPVIAISSPIYDQNGGLRGVVSADISAREIIKMVEEATIKGLGYSFLIDGAGNIIAHPEYSLQSETDMINIDSLSQGIYAQLVGAGSGQIQTEFDGVDGFLSYEPLEDTDWIIGNFMSMEDFMGNRWDKWEMFLTALIIAAIIFGIFFYLQRASFLNPVANLDRDIRKIDVVEDIGYRLPIRGKDPLIEIRSSINIILDKTKEYFEQTEQDSEEIMAQNEELEASYNQLSAMEEELREQYDLLLNSEEKLRNVLVKNEAIMSAIPDILFIYDKDGVYVDIQGEYAGNLIAPESDLLGKKLTDILPEEIGFLVLNRISKVLERDQMEFFEYNLDVETGMQSFEVRMVKLDERHVLAITRNISDRKEMENRLINLSYRDQLTGLYNRRFFEEELSRLDVERNLPLSIIMSDVNGLKLINDSFGHRVGDELLKTIANVMIKGCRADDIIARISGDEFVVILPKTNEAEAEVLTNRLKKLGRETKFSNEAFPDLELSISFGIGTKHSMDMDMALVFKKAEDNMYAHKLLEGPSMRSKTIETIIKALYEKNEREEKHSNRVSLICQDMGKALGLGEDKIRELGSVGLLHDIGKIAISEAILDKPGKLTKEEWEEMKKHPEIGYRILSTVNEMGQIAEYILYHHERYDGFGYPKGLKGEEIPFISRIITIADAYDAMAADRPYRKALTHEEIIREFIDHAGSQFDPYLTKVFVEELLGYEDIL